MNLRLFILLALVPALACKGDTSPVTDTEGTSTTSSSSSGSSSGTETEASSSESSSSTGPMPCVSDEECSDAAAPFCDATGICVPCDQAPLPADANAACATAEPATPICLAGTCVQCTADEPAACTGETPLCDDAGNTCVPCTAHDQCGPAACNLYTGACLPMDAVVHVGGDPEVDLPSFDTLSLAIESFTAEDAQGTILVHDGPSYDESATVDGTRVLAFLAANDAVMPPRWIRSSGNTPQLTVETGATVLMDGLQLSGNASGMVPGLRVTGGRAWVDKSRIVQNTGGGIVAQNAAELTLRSCFVGRSENNIAALDVNDATAVVSYSTIIGGTGSLAEGLSCTAGSAVSVGNTIVLFESDNPPVLCDAATFDHSVSEIVLPGTDNVNVGDFTDVSGWFTDTVGGNFHLSGTHPVAIDAAALWSTGDPLTDIDGDPRATIDGTADFAGADVP